MMESVRIFTLVCFVSSAFSADPLGDVFSLLYLIQKKMASQGGFHRLSRCQIHCSMVVLDQTDKFIRLETERL